MMAGPPIGLSIQRDGPRPVLVLSRSLLLVPSQSYIPDSKLFYSDNLRQKPRATLHSWGIVKARSYSARSAQNPTIFSTDEARRFLGTGPSASTSCSGSCGCLCGKCDIHGIGHLGARDSQIRHRHHQLACGAGCPGLGRSDLSRWVPITRYRDEDR